MMIYIASSWRTPRHNEVVDRLRRAGHEVYDYRNPDDSGQGFSWESVDPNWRNWSMREFNEALYSDAASDAYWRDYLAMEAADVLVGVQPFGASAGMEMGWAAGRGKPTILLLDDDPPQPELMIKMLHVRAFSIDQVIDHLKVIENYLVNNDPVPPLRQACSVSFWVEPKEIPGVPEFDVPPSKSHHFGGHVSGPAAQAFINTMKMVLKKFQRVKLLENVHGGNDAGM